MKGSLESEPTQGKVVEALSDHQLLQSAMAYNASHLLPPLVDASHKCYRQHRFATGEASSLHHMFSLCGLLYVLNRNELQIPQFCSCTWKFTCQRLDEIFKGSFPAPYNCTLSMSGQKR